MTEENNQKRLRAITSLLFMMLWDEGANRDVFLDRFVDLGDINDYAEGKIIALWHDIQIELGLIDSTNKE